MNNEEAIGAIELTLPVFLDRIAIRSMLIQYGNADKVLSVMLKRGMFTRPVTCYTIAPIIVNIGDMSSDEYIAYSDRVCAEFEQQRANTVYQIMKK